MSQRIDDMNRAVTDALTRAERALVEARNAWVDVEKFEGALAIALREEGHTAELEYDIALRGVGRAFQIVEILSAIGEDSL